VTAFTPATDPFIVNTVITRVQGSPAVATLTGGGFVVVWTDDSTGSIKAQLLDTAGGKVGSEFQINNFTAGSQASPDVVALTNGGFVVTWSDDSRTLGDSFTSGIHAQIYSATGLEVGSEFLANTRTDGWQSNPAVTALANGAFAISWFDENRQGDGFVRMQVFDSAGNKPNSERLVANDDGNERTPDMVTLTNGNVAIAWNDRGLFKSAVYTRNGGLVATGAVVSRTLASAGTEIAALSNGGYLMGWIDGPVNNKAFSVQRFTATGALDGAEIEISPITDSHRGTALLGLEGGGFVVVWPDDSSVPGDTGTSLLGRVYDASGVPDGDIFVVGPDLSGYSDVDPELAARPGGGFVVTWMGPDGGTGSYYPAGIVARVYDVVPDQGPPVAVGDVVGATEDQTAIIAANSLADNDSDPDGDPLTVIGVSNALHGSVVLNGDGTVSFTPDADFNGAASFDYTIEDLAGNPATASVTVNVANVNDAPRNIAFDGVVLDTAADGTSAGTISAFDVDGDTVTYALTDDAGGRFAIDADTGVLSVANIALFDFANVDEYQISAIATDSLGASGPETDLIVTLGRVLAGATNGDDRLTARSDRNWYISGLGGNDTLVGRLGNDHMMGGLGDDYYYFRNVGDVVIEQADEGHDTVQAYVDLTLPDTVEDLLLVGGAAHVGTGNALDNHLSAGGGADTLTGLAGDDRLDGWAGSDILDGGIGDDRLIGGDGNDTMFGGDGNDRLEGQAGIDTLNGGAGDDMLIDGAGRDVMVGGAGADLVVFHDGDFGGATTSTADRILDFNAAEGDRIHLGAVDAKTGTPANDAFRFIGTAAFGGMAGQLRYFQQAGDTFFAGDTNGDSAADFTVRVVGLHTLTASNFVL